MTVLMLRVQSILGFYWMLAIVFNPGTTWSLMYIEAQAPCLLALWLGLLFEYLKNFFRYKK